jgi:hypothetical protein
MSFDLTGVLPIELVGSCNTNQDELMAQVDSNIRRGLPQAKPHAPNPATAILVCSGPSLRTTENELRDAFYDGGKIIAVNGAYQWCIDKGFLPSAAVIIDARLFNTRFLETEIVGCRYLLASQCHPNLFDLCRERATTIWHACSFGDKELDLLRAYYYDHVYPVTIGTTVGVRAISLLRMLGFMRMDIFGMDSCWIGNENHAFSQAENDDDTLVPIWLRPEGRDDKAQKFVCSPWQCKQFSDVMELIRERGDQFELNFRGPGLIATAIRTGAEIEMGE